MLEKYKKYEFLFTELVKRDFKRKYKGTSLGMLWSILAPLLNLLVLDVVFSKFFGRDTPNYITYLFSGLLVFNYFSESTRTGMTSLLTNAKIFTKVNVPKYLFLFSKNVSCFINFLLTLCIYFVFCIIDHIHFGFHMLALIYPIIMLAILNVGVGMILSALFVFFRDIEYLYSIFLTLLRYLSVIFYTLNRFTEQEQRVFMLNPVYVIIKYIRQVVIYGQIPSLAYHGLMLLYAGCAFGLGCFFYKKYNTQFLYYV